MARWTLAGGIEMNKAHYSPEMPVDTPRILCLLAHEARHIQQGPLVALSVYGELDAWQLDFRMYQRLVGGYSHPAVDELLSLPLALDRAVLKRAQTLMQDYAGKGYRSDLLPLYPIHLEIKYWLTRK